MAVERTVLAERHATLILSAMLEIDEPVTLSRLTQYVTSYRTLELLVSQLEESKLIEITKLSIPTKSILVSLTPRGKKVAEQIKIANDICLGRAESHAAIRY